uniref:Pecanex-like protein n=1 Tax=Macrostomum lignano TaxID=282301 RepID=A0A1I8FC98_9PLAT
RQCKLQAKVKAIQSSALKRLGQQLRFRSFTPRNSTSSTCSSNDEAAALSTVGNSPASSTNSRVRQVGRRGSKPVHRRLSERFQSQRQVSPQLSGKLPQHPHLINSECGGGGGGGGERSGKSDTDAEAVAKLQLQTLSHGTN